MNEMIERVARAMWENWRTLEIASPVMASCDFDEICRLAGLPGEIGQKARVVVDAGYAQARAAIAAMREPTEAIIDAVFKIEGETDDEREPARVQWREMIDAALAEDAPK